MTTASPTDDIVHIPFLFMKELAFILCKHSEASREDRHRIPTFFRATLKIIRTTTAAVTTRYLAPERTGFGKEKSSQDYRLHRKVTAVIPFNPSPPYPIRSFQIHRSQSDVYIITKDPHKHGHSNAKIRGKQHPYIHPSTWHPPGPYLLLISEKFLLHSCSTLLYLNQPSQTIIFLKRLTSKAMVSGSSVCLFRITCSLPIP